MNKKIIWRKNFSIRGADLRLAVETMPGIGGLNYLTVGKNVLSKGLFMIENGDIPAAYVNPRELRELVRRTIDAIIKTPGRVDTVHKKTITLNTRYFELARTIQNMRLEKKSDRQLLALHDRLFQLQYASHCAALPTTWWIDSDDQDFSRHLLSFVEKRVADKRLPEHPASVFSILTTPQKPSLEKREEEQTLKIVSWIQSIPKLRRWFEAHGTAELAQSYPLLPPAWKNKMLRHYRSWRWLPYGYVGPAYTFDYYLDVWKGLVREGIAASRVRAEGAKKTKDIIRQRIRFIAALELTTREKHWFDIAADIVWLKGFRKDCYFHGFYTVDLLLAEMAKRSGLSLMQIKYLRPEELPLALKGRDFSDIANERRRFCIVYGTTQRKKSLLWSGCSVNIYTGERAKKFLRSQQFETVQIEKTDRLSGTCACPGKAAGIIKVVNAIGDMPKMSKGDIMLSHTTFPALVPAMKKAAAIITEDGGITCHAAIVARELQIPCVVGCKNALSLLKDGDNVEVDAAQALVTIQ